jgi:hypothetical protein
MRTRKYAWSSRIIRTAARGAYLVLAVGISVVVVVGASSGTDRIRGTILGGGHADVGTGDRGRTGEGRIDVIPERQEPAVVPRDRCPPHRPPPVRGRTGVGVARLALPRSPPVRQNRDAVRRVPPRRDAAGGGRYRGRTKSFHAMIYLRLVECVADTTTSSWYIDGNCFTPRPGWGPTTIPPRSINTDKYHHR